MLRDAEDGKFEVIVFYYTSRLTRRPMEYERLISLVDSHHVRLASVVSGEVDLTRADGRFVARVLASADAAEAERISERVARAARQRAEQGESHGG